MIREQDDDRYLVFKRTSHVVSSESSHNCKMLFCQLIHTSQIYLSKGFEYKGKRPSYHEGGGGTGASAG